MNKLQLWLPYDFIYIWRNLWSRVKKICETASRPKNPQISTGSLQVTGASLLFLNIILGCLVARRRLTGRCAASWAAWSGRPGVGAGAHPGWRRRSWPAPPTSRTARSPSSPATVQTLSGSNYRNPGTCLACERPFYSANYNTNFLKFQKKSWRLQILWTLLSYTTSRFNGKSNSNVSDHYPVIFLTCRIRSIPFRIQITPFLTLIKR